MTGHSQSHTLAVFFWVVRNLRQGKDNLRWRCEKATVRMQPAGEHQEPAVKCIGYLQRKDAVTSTDCICMLLLRKNGAVMRLLRGKLFKTTGSNLP